MTIHEEIKKTISGYDPSSVNHLVNIENEILKLKEKGFNIIYTLGYDTRGLENRYKK